MKGFRIDQAVSSAMLVLMSTYVLYTLESCYSAVLFCQSACLPACSDLLLQCRANKSRDEVNSGKSAFLGKAPWSQVILILILILVGRKSLSPYIPHIPQGMTSTVPRCRAGVLSLSRYEFLEPRPPNTFSPCKSSKGPWVSNVFLLSLSFVVVTAFPSAAMGLGTVL